MNELLSTALKLPTRLRSQDYIILNAGKAAVLPATGPKDPGGAGGN